ncbi:hypothetical protein SAMN04515679_1102 [Pelosinus fermentans]|jgi:hypothetical protein|uniref:Uncharacterized protein n=1 Tax=Pelosinus fermentans B4 TaxID=1149862 RepID=I9LIE5_9FIRM|nr:MULTISPECIES: hypothetical protein [Pelosinus]EIW20166.1 hypothetical protein FB4_2598 [Pelosinus fermentans B4]OAM93028.1 hypothetical protein FR7_01044 [Pelosinus fermentans DSM 17108]SDQ64606.1 hypothetical protein SAMN04515679_1102 [Pelosinus fermentans]
MSRKKKVMRAIFAALAAVFISGTVLLPTATKAFAAEPTNQEQSAPPEDAPKDNGNEHSGHHM